MEEASGSFSQKPPLYPPLLPKACHAHPYQLLWGVVLVPKQAGLERSLKARGKGFNPWGEAVLLLCLPSPYCCFSWDKGQMVPVKSDH